MIRFAAATMLLVHRYSSYDDVTATLSTPEQPRSAQSFMTTSRSSLLGLKNGIRLAGTWTRAPVLGFRPIRPCRCRVRKVPKPRISILSPRSIAFTMLSRTHSTMTPASFCGSSATLATSAIKSAFVRIVELTPACDGVPIQFMTMAVMLTEQRAPVNPPRLACLPSCRERVRNYSRA